MLQAYVLFELYLLGMNGKDLDASGFVGSVDQHLPVEAPGAQQRGVENFGAVGRREQHKARRRIEAVELDQQLVQRLLFLVVAADPVGAARSTERVELVDEDDRRRLLPRLLEGP